MIRRQKGTPEEHADFAILVKRNEPAAVKREIERIKTDPELNEDYKKRFRAWLVHEGEASPWYPLISSGEFLLNEPGRMKPFDDDKSLDMHILLSEWLGVYANPDDMVGIPAGTTSNGTTGQKGQFNFESWIQGSEHHMFASGFHTSKGDAFVVRLAQLEKGKAYASLLKGARTIDDPLDYGKADGLFLQFCGAWDWTDVIPKLQKEKRKELAQDQYGHPDDKVLAGMAIKFLEFHAKHWKVPEEKDRMEVVSGTIREMYPT